MGSPVTMNGLDADPPPPASVTITRYGPGETLGTAKVVSKLPTASATPAPTATVPNTMFMDISAVKADPVTVTIVCGGPLEGFMMIEPDANVFGVIAAKMHDTIMRLSEKHVMRAFLFASIESTSETVSDIGAMLFKN